MKIQLKDIEHLAELSDFELSAAEAESLQGDLQKIVEYISELDGLNVEGVQPTYQVFDMENVWREDEILEQEAGREELLALAPEQLDHQIKVPKVL